MQRGYTISMQLRLNELTDREQRRTKMQTHKHREDCCNNRRAMMDRKKKANHVENKLI